MNYTPGDLALTELTIDDIEGSQYNQTQENQHQECCQSADRDHGYLR